ncbi:glycosyl hydrolase-related protein [Caldivirga maquilingensis]|uniref:Glycosyl hydrolase 38 domain protein n=1 Tax=Caldivirga maquilingensis (strain ATCC 700844 / DSM 13496 / JCM 10307 / IC-167) TaxID=397948 RepID=A8MCD7_CALMQ|nr:glycosyl hydrolase-related protein [Caldivirga maquilingensis]ABW01443.1 glycosyl hydrolase 38 domain protein [Caldivirga maquilingensis IC-167]
MRNIDAWVKPTGFITKSGLRGLLIYVRNKSPYQVKFTVNDREFTAGSGLNWFLTEVKPNESIEVKFETGESYSFKPNFQEPRKFRVHIAPTVHTDYGYTDVQSRVEEIHRGNMDVALKISSRGGKFVIEVTEQPFGRIMELLDANRRGLIGVQAFPLNVLTGLCNHEELIRLFYGVRDLRRAGFSIETAALNDIPSAVYALPSVLASCGIKYYIQGANPDRGPLHKLNTWLKSPFKWIGPDGNGVLAWFSGGYGGLIPGFHGYHQGWSAGLLISLDRAEAGLAHFLTTLEERGYQYENVLLYGMFIDNWPASDRFIDVVREFNEKWENPQLIISTTDDFFHEIEREVNGKINSIKGSFGAYWEDGAASTARELAALRLAKKLLYFAEVAYAFDYIKGLRYPKGDIDEAWRSVIYFDEHTWGAWNSVSDPYNPSVLEQWRIKAGFADKALNKAMELTRGDYVSNPYPFTVSGIIENTYVELPSMASRPFIRKPLVRRSVESKNLLIESPYYKVTIKDGKVVSVIDKELNVELIDSSKYTLDEYLYVLGGKGTSMERTILNYLYEGEPTGPVFSIIREYSSRVTGVYENDDVVTVVIESDSYLSKIRKEITLPKARRELIIRNTVDKSENYDKEGVYFAFPFNLSKPRVLIEEPGAFIDVENELIEGGCANWFAANNIVLLKGEFDIAFYTEEAPLVTIGSIFDGVWRGSVKVNNGLLFSYVMNNYWHTNYKAAQGGSFTFTYRLTSSRAIKPSQAHRFFSSPVIGRAINGDLTIDPPEVVVTTVKKWDLGDGVVLRLLEVDGEAKSLTIRSRTLNGYKAYLANPLEEPIEELGEFTNGELKVSVKPRSYLTIVVKRS